MTESEQFQAQFRSASNQIGGLVGGLGPLAIYIPVAAVGRSEETGGLFLWDYFFALLSLSFLVLFFEPRIATTRTHVVIENPLTVWNLPWDSISEIRLRDRFVHFVLTDGRSVTALGVESFLAQTLVGRSSTSEAIGSLLEKRRRVEQAEASAAKSTPLSGEATPQRRSHAERKIRTPSVLTQCAAACWVAVLLRLFFVG